MYYLGSHVKTDGWSDTYNQHLELTGTIRELAPSDNNDNTDTRFQLPLDTDEENIPAVAEGYRLAASEIIAPAISISVNKEIPRERRKRDAPLDNSSISPSAFQSINNNQVSATLSNNDTDDDTIISDADEKAWALSLSLSAGFDGSGSEERKLFFLIFQLNKLQSLFYYLSYNSNRVYTYRNNNNNSIDYN